MAWVYLDDHFPDHPKVVAAGGEAAWLFVCGLAYIKRYATDGTIPKARLSQLSDRKQPKRLAGKLTASGLWIDEGAHYKVHDYHEWNRPSESRSAAGRKAAEARWSRAKRIPDADADAMRTHSESQYERNANGDASGCTIPNPIPIETKSSSDLRGGEHSSAGGGIIDQAVRLAAKRYAEDQMTNGKGKNPDGLARWWLQENAEGAKVRAAHLLEGHDLTLTQLADALLQPNPPWLRFYRRPEPAT